MREAISLYCDSWKWIIDHWKWLIKESWVIGVAWVAVPLVFGHTIATFRESSVLLIFVIWAVGMVHLSIKEEKLPVREAAQGALGLVIMYPVMIMFTLLALFPILLIFRLSLW